jgi:hypothetical protein
MIFNSPHPCPGSYIIYILEDTVNNHGIFKDEDDVGAWVWVWESHAVNSSVYTDLDGEGKKEVNQVLLV